MTDSEFDACLQQGVSFKTLYLKGYNIHSIINHQLFESSLKQQEESHVDFKNASAVEWMGFLYAYWHYSTGESFADIVRQACPERMLKMYPGLHCEDNDMAISDLKSLYQVKPQV